MSTQLYALQAEALERWRHSARRGIVEAVTAAGKTQIGIEAIREAVQDGLHSLVLVPTKELQTQWFLRVTDELVSDVKIGLRGGEFTDVLGDVDVLISIINSSREIRGVPQGSLVVADECHRYPTESNLTALHRNFERRLGLTATLERVDGEHELLEEYFGGICYTIDYVGALTDGIISPFSVAFIGMPMKPAERAEYTELSREVASAYAALVAQHRIDTSSFATFMKEVNRLTGTSSKPGAPEAERFKQALIRRRRLLAESGTKAAFVERLVPAIRVADRALVFTDAKSTAEDIAAGLRAHGIPAAHTHSELDDVERRNRLGWFKEDRLKVLVAPRILDEGVDVPEADLAVVVSAARSRRQMIQRMGRILRRKNGRIARLAVLYLEDTIEDPACGAHEGFLDEVVDVANDLAVFRSGEFLQANVYLASLSPLSEVREPRFVGGPPRKPIWSAGGTPDVDVRAALGLIEAQRH